MPVRLKRQLGVAGATAMGLGSIVGTGIFVSLGLAAGAAGPAVLLAVVIAALVATCNGMSSAQLAAAHPVSGGTYEYGYRWLHPSLGFLAGWMFVWAKSASAATAALGFSAYVLGRVTTAGGIAHTAAALAMVLLVVAAILAGLRLSNAVNIALVSVSIGSLLAFVAGGLPRAWAQGAEAFFPFFAPVEGGEGRWSGFLEACALMFVAYTGYGRIATLGEEVRRPERSIPLAIGITLLLTAALYFAVAVAAVGTLGAGDLFRATRAEAAPLEAAARRLGRPAIEVFVSVGASTAMASVLLNLVLGLSRVILAMGRRRDLPAMFGQVNRSGTTPAGGVWLVAAIVGGLVLIGDVKTTWSFSAFSVLIYYAITNLAALRLKEGERMFPRVLPAAGLASCAFLAFWVEPRVWLTGLCLLGGGLVWWAVARIISKRRGDLA